MNIKKLKRKKEKIQKEKKVKYWKFGETKTKLLINHDNCLNRLNKYDRETLDVTRYPYFKEFFKNILLCMYVLLIWLISDFRSPGISASLYIWIPCLLIIFYSCFGILLTKVLDVDRYHTQNIKKGEESETTIVVKHKFWGNVFKIINLVIVIFYFTFPLVYDVLTKDIKLEIIKDIVNNVSNIPKSLSFVKEISQMDRTSLLLKYTPLVMTIIGLVIYIWKYKTFIWIKYYYVMPFIIYFYLCEKYPNSKGFKNLQLKKKTIDLRAIKKIKKLEETKKK